MLSSACSLPCRRDYPYPDIVHIIKEQEQQWRPRDQTSEGDVTTISASIDLGSSAPAFGGRADGRAGNDELVNGCHRNNKYQEERDGRNSGEDCSGDPWGARTWLHLSIPGELNAGVNNNRVAAIGENPSGAGAVLASILRSFLSALGFPPAAFR